MINVSNQKFIICMNPNKPIEEREYLTSYNGIDAVEAEDFEVLKDPYSAYKFEIYSQAINALHYLREFGHRDVEIMIMESIINIRNPTKDETQKELCQTAIDKLTTDELSALVDHIKGATIPGIKIIS